MNLDNNMTTHADFLRATRENLLNHVVARIRLLSVFIYIKNLVQ